MRIWKRIDLGAERRSYDLPIDGTVTTVYKKVVTETKSDDLRKFVAEQKETRRFDNQDLGEIAYKEITEKRYTLRCDLYEASDMALDDSGIFGKGVQIQVTTTLAPTLLPQPIAPPFCPILTVKLTS